MQRIVGRGLLRIGKRTLCKLVATPVLALALSINLLATKQAPAADDHHDMTGHKHIALFLGTGEEFEDADHWHEAEALGLEFEYRLSNSVGVGAVIEHLNITNRGNTVIVAPFSYHIGKGFRAFAGPGYEFKNSTLESKFLLRVGIGYEFHIGGCVKTRRPSCSRWPLFHL